MDLRFERGDGETEAVVIRRFFQSEGEIGRVGDRRVLGAGVRDIVRELDNK